RWGRRRAPCRGRSGHCLATPSRGRSTLRVRTMIGPNVLPRAVHPGAWWLWALGLAAAASRTSNPLLLVLVMCTAGYVVARRRTDAPWALAFRFYLLVGVFIIVSRVFFRVVFGGGQGEIVLFTLPEIPLPETAGGIRLLGPVALEQLLSGLYDGLRLATVVVCVGAANALGQPQTVAEVRSGSAVRGRYVRGRGDDGGPPTPGERAPRPSSPPTTRGPTEGCACPARHRHPRAGGRPRPLLGPGRRDGLPRRSEEHTSELQSRFDLV